MNIFKIPSHTNLIKYLNILGNFCLLFLIQVEVFFVWFWWVCCFFNGNNNKQIFVHGA